MLETVQRADGCSCPDVIGSAEDAIGKSMATQVTSPISMLVGFGARRASTPSAAALEIEIIHVSLATAPRASRRS